MKLKLPSLISAILPFLALTASAQEYEHLTISSGLTADVIANGTGPAASSTTMLVDNDSFAFMTADFLPATITTPPAYALPVSGLINSAATTGLSFQMAPYSGNNSLRIATTSGTGTLAFTNQVMATKVFLLATSGSGSSTVTVKVNFTDDTFQTQTSLVVPDWYNSTALPVVTSGFGRVNVTTNALENPAGNPRLYQLAININAENQPKLIESIEVTKTSTAEGVVNVMGVTAEVLPECPSPANLTATSTADAGTVSWSVPVIAPSGGYDYYMSTVNTPPTGTTTVTNTTETSATFDDLDTGVTHYVWVRSNCGGELGAWVMTSFTTGQVSATYTAGDLPSLYTGGGEPPASSSTPCPAELSVTVPDGYQVASVNVAYSMTAQGGAWKSEQRTLLHCATSGIGEATVTAGPDEDAAGTVSYSRTGLNIADGMTGTVQFELKVWRVWGGADCNTTYNKVDNGTYTITVTYEPFVCNLDAPEAEDMAACGGITVADLTAEATGNAELHWYATEDAVEPLADDTAVAAGTYYVSQYIGTCESDRTAVTFSINTVEPPTVAEPVQTLCPGALVANLTAEADAGGVLLWFTSEDAPNPVGTSTSLEEGTYYVVQQMSGCRSIKVPVEVVFEEVPVPTAEDQSVCEGATVADLMAEGGEEAELHWYTTYNSIAELGADAVLEEDSYFVSQSFGACESERVEIMVTFATVPVPVAEDQSVCEGSTAAELMAETTEEGAMLHWYPTADAPEMLGEDAVLEEGSYFVSQSLEGCGESERVEIMVSFNEIAAPETETNQYFCGSATVGELFEIAEEGAMVNWYASEDAEEPLAEDAEIEAGTYFVRQVIDGCEGAANDTHVFITPIPELPGGEVVQEFEEGETVADLEITIEDGAEVTWYVMNDADEMVVIESTQELEDDMVYYVTQTIEGCEGEPLMITAQAALGVAEFNNDNLKVFPNPVNNVLTIASGESLSKVTVTNMLGQKVIETAVNGNEVQVDVAKLAHGTYMLQLESQSGSSYTTKIVKQ